MQKATEEAAWLEQQVRATTQTHVSNANTPPSRAHIAWSAEWRVRVLSPPWPLAWCPCRRPTPRVASSLSKTRSRCAALPEEAPRRRIRRVNPDAAVNRGVYGKSARVAPPPPPLQDAARGPPSLPLAPADPGAPLASGNTSHH